MENKLFGASELSTINTERLVEIKNYALIEYNRYIYRTKPHNHTFHHMINYNSKSQIFLNLNSGITLTLENYMEYKANTKDFPLNNDIEKIFFMCNGVFPNDEKFLNILKQYDYLNMFDEFIRVYIDIDEKYRGNEKRANMHKSMQYINFIKSHKKELIEITEYFSRFHCITDIHLVINKLLQICYFNPELYNSYVETDEDKKTNQKVKMS